MRWHLAGHLQTNKVRKALRLFRVIHSVDSLKLAKVIDEEAGRSEVDAFIEVNSGESQKSGLPSGELGKFLEEARRTLSELKKMNPSDTH